MGPYMESLTADFFQFLAKIIKSFVLINELRDLVGEIPSP